MHGELIDELERRIRDDVVGFRAVVEQEVDRGRTVTAIDEIGLVTLYPAASRTRLIEPSPQAGSQMVPPNRTAESRAQVPSGGVG
jgi:hypothetical protein